MKIPTSQKPRPRITAWIGYLLLCTMLLTCVTFSNYVTSSTGGDSARVAKFDVRMVGNTDEIHIDGSDSTDDLTGSYTLTVTNNSEVAVEYSITVLTDTSLPAGIQLTIGNETKNTDGSSTNYSYTGGILRPGETRNHTLTVTALLDTLAVNVDQAVTVSVTAEQID